MYSVHMYVQCHVWHGLYLQASLDRFNEGATNGSISLTPMDDRSLIAYQGTCNYILYINTPFLKHSFLYVAIYQRYQNYFRIDMKSLFVVITKVC